jgi:hypothetical protein
MTTLLKQALTLPTNGHNTSLSTANVKTLAARKLSAFADVAGQRVTLPAGDANSSAVSYTPTTLAEILKGSWVQTNGGAANFTMPSNTTTLQAIQTAGSLGVAGANLDWAILNLGAGVTTLTASASFTIEGTAAIAAGDVAICRVVCTNPATPAFTCIRIG